MVQFAALLGSLAPFVIIACMIPAMIYSGRWATGMLPELSVGSDGVAIRVGARKAVRFVPHERIERVEIVRHLPKNLGAYVVELVAANGD